MVFEEKLQAFCHALPVKIGSTAYIIRNYHGIRVVKEGTVSELYFTSDMRLMATVKYVGRGEINKNVFASREEAERRIHEEISQGC